MPSHCACTTTPRPACAVSPTRPEEISSHTPSAVGSGFPPIFSILLVPAGRIPRINSLSTKLPRVPEPSATYLNGFRTFFNSPAPRASRNGRADYDRDGDVLARVLCWAWPGWGGVRNVLPVWTRDPFVASPDLGVPVAADFHFSLLILGYSGFFARFYDSGL